MEDEGPLGIPGLSLKKDAAQPPCVSGTQGSCSPVRQSGKGRQCCPAIPSSIKGKGVSSDRKQGGRWSCRGSRALGVEKGLT